MEGLNWPSFLEFLNVLLCVLHATHAQDVMVCGGFVKADVEINFSQVEVKLYTPQGSLKYSTDCAPNNGYYSIPLYDKGDFILKVEPPDGWSFDPAQVELHIDGATDPCSKGADINFQFQGFGIEGQVISKGTTQGPAGIQVFLKKEGAAEVLQSQKTGPDGGYKFTKVLPGNYVVEASHPKWEFEKAKVEVTVGNANTKVVNNIVIAGYDVHGQVLSEGEPIKGVNFVLFSKTIKQKDVNKCDKTPIKGVGVPEGSKQLCFVVSQLDGKFLFPSLPSGSYSLIPYYKGEKIKFDVLPELIDVQVNHGTVNIKEPFQVAGFSVTGRVLEAAQGSGVANAQLSIDGKRLAVTNAEGIYQLENMKTGTYKIKVEANRIYFDDVSMKISPNTPQLPDIIASKFSLCGRVVIDNYPPGLTRPDHRKVSIKGDSTVIGLSTDKEGQFCTKVQPGAHVVKTLVSKEEEEAGLKLTPAERIVKVVDRPVDDVTFTQFRAKISGTVTCLEKCKNIHISLIPIAREDDGMAAKIKEGSKGGTFTLENVLPGKYKANLLNDIWCWKSKVLDVEVTDKDVTGVDFQQTGYMISVTSSHDLKLAYTNQDKKLDYRGTFDDVVKGLNKFCLEKPGLYKLKPESCHRFDKEEYSFDTGKPIPLTLTATSHRIDGSIKTDIRIRDIMLSIKTVNKDGTKEETRGPLRGSKDNIKMDDQFMVGPMFYDWDHWAKTGDTVVFQPSSKHILFYPQKADIVVQGDSCPISVKFDGKEGVFIEGLVREKSGGQDGLGGVMITITPKNNENVKVSILTFNDGSFEHGPFHGNTEYVVEPSMEGYIFEEVHEMLPYHWFAIKLGKVTVKVVGEKDQPLNGVLLSLSGGDFRSNNLTVENGTMVFSNLHPGQFFLRPIMKEYKFEPASQMIEVREGSDVKINIKGFRVAFSCYGSVTSLNGEPEPSILVEAVGLDDCASHQEESKTEADGSYRIRGLQPKCSYKLQLRDDPANQHISRAEPRDKIIKVEDSDLNNVNIIAFRRLNQMDISGNIKTSKEHLSSLKVKLFKEDNPDSPIGIVSLGTSVFFYLPSVTIDKETAYVIRLESTLARSMYDYTLPEVKFYADSSYRHFTFEFNPKRKSLEQELNQGSFLILPLIILVATLAYFRQQLIPLAQQGIQSLQMSVQKGGSTGGNGVGAGGDAGSVDLLTRKKQKARKIN
ncbi:nodal modulator 2 [Lingula anatina]|uniref:Nodal modulator 2 n=1 Tax=Lingula anatina TaxID=7574 RepID=A0A1S3IRC7_LINAN|nr:nodal modulator 2 [Lingula anatina]|eukprot:XP_013400762.1 nodal modulator 2 [Lingula anatina]